MIFDKRTAVVHLPRGHLQTMWIVFGMFLTPLSPNMDQFTPITWIIFRNFHPLPLTGHMVCRRPLSKKPQETTRIWKP